MEWKRFIALAAIVYGASALALLLLPSLRKRLEPPLPFAQIAAAELAALPPAAPLSFIVEPDDGAAPVRAAITDAKKSVDVVIYELEDPDIERLLADAHDRGVAVRVLLQNVSAFGNHPNQEAYDFLISRGVAVAWAPAFFALTHQKTIITDRSRALIMTFNLVPKYYDRSRDFGIVDENPIDVAAIAAAFDGDWNGDNVHASPGRDLVWSPGSLDALLTLIDTASTTLDIYNEEMADPRIMHALEAAAARGVVVRVVMTYSTNWKAALNELVQSSVGVRTYASSASFYIHAKAIIADGARAFVGSENFSVQSLDMNRELGIFIARPDAINTIESTFEHDWNSARPYAVR